MHVLDAFRIDGKVAVVTGGSGVLGSAMALALAQAGARVCLTGRAQGKVHEVASAFSNDGHQVEAYAVDGFEAESLADCRDAIVDAYGKIDVLVNAVGGNRSDATAPPGSSFFDLPVEALRDVVDLNLFGGAMLPCQVFGAAMADNPAGGSMINVSSMAAMRPLTRIAAYSPAKAAVSNFTQWLAVHVAETCGPALRVNALAPGFFLTDQNRFLLTADGDPNRLTARGQQIVAHTPMRRFGQPDDLAGATVWLASDASVFVTGIVLPVDGGFSAFSGV